jgi:hypothetical protein
MFQNIDWEEGFFQFAFVGMPVLAIAMVVVSSIF